MSASLPYDPRRSRWIPWVFGGGLLLVVAVNVALITAAISTFTGVTAGHAYDRGRAYNDVLQEAARQEALGWTTQVTLEGELLTVTARDREGRPLFGHVEGVLLRPIEGTTVPLDFSAEGEGCWAAHAGIRKPGQWEARLTLRAGDAALDIRQRVLVR
jgi:nitrogen fixation protein FixH